MMMSSPGLPNAQVARALLERGLAKFEGVVYLDDADRKMILLRRGWATLPLERAGVPREKRFTFYDQVHTTGMDIKQCLNA